MASLKWDSSVISSEQRSQTTVDIAIIGGGIAGSSVAITLQRAGYQTAVIEREPVFRDRVRGEACHPWGVRELIELDLKQIVDQSGSIDLPNWAIYKDRQLESSFAWANTFPNSPPEIGFNHPKLQTQMLDAARDAGVDIFRPANATIVRWRDGWLLEINHEHAITDLRASFLIAADGRTSSTRRLWGAKPISDPAHHKFGGLLMRGIDLPRNSAHQAYHACGFSMLFHQDSDGWRMYYVCPIEAASSFVGEDRLQRYIDACAACLPEDALRNARPAGPLAFFPNSHVGTSRIAGPNAVAIGDAAGAGDPSQGHGMALVWRDVRVLRDVLATHGFQDAPAAFAEQRRAYEYVLHCHSAWVAPLTTDTDAAANALREQVDRARAADPSALGYAGIFAIGPDGLPTDDAARMEFFGEHLSHSPA